MIQKFRHKPIVVKALQWTGHNLSEVKDFMGYAPVVAADVLIISTLQGRALALPGDWVIKGGKGDFYPCNHHVFEGSYEKAE